MQGNYNPEITTKTLSFDFTCASFARYVADNHDTASEEVSALEHITFLAMSLSYFVLCSSSLQISKKFIPMAT
jgi:prephenate dehydrogenase